MAIQLQFEWFDVDLGICLVTFESVTLEYCMVTESKRLRGNTVWSLKAKG